MSLLVDIDEGTSAVKAVLFDAELRTLKEARREKKVAYPRPGWVEQDGEEVLEAVVEAVAELLADQPDVAACGLDPPGESGPAWGAETGPPPAPNGARAGKRPQPGPGPAPGR